VLNSKSWESCGSRHGVSDNGTKASSGEGAVIKPARRLENKVEDGVEEIYSRTGLNQDLFKLPVPARWGSLVWPRDPNTSETEDCPRQMVLSTRFSRFVRYSGEDILRF
jgi:hypothetical protein